MAKLYTKNTWQDEILSGDERYDIKENGGASFKTNMQIILSTIVSQVGTALTAALMNNIETGLDDLDSKVAVIEAGTAGSVVTSIKAWLKTYFDTLYPVSRQTGYLRDNSAQLIYVGAAAYSVLPGSADVNGTLLTWVSNIARTSLTLSADTVYYVYLYSNSGTPAVEESTTAPAWSATLNYYQKTGDATRRCIGFIATRAANTIRKFNNNVYGRTSEFIYIDGETNLFSTKEVVSAGATTASWASFSLATLVPAHATDWWCSPKISFNASGDDCILGISPIDLGASPTAGDAPFTIRGQTNVAAARLFTGRAWLPIVTASTYYYRINRLVGTATAYIEAHGARIIR